MRTNRALTTFSTLSALALGLTLTLSGCGSSDSGGGDSSSAAPSYSATEHNDADVTFASEMMQHHAQALAMVDLTQGRDLDPAVQAVVDGIRAAQAPEIETMAGWLGDWNEPIPATVRDHANAGHGMAGMDEAGMADMPGMMSAAEMTDLANADDASFPGLWLEMMIRHHEGAVEMAAAETADGQFQPAVDLAGSITSSQTDEIATMQALLP